MTSHGCALGEATARSHRARWRTSHRRPSSRFRDVISRLPRRPCVRPVRAHSQRSRRGAAPRRAKSADRTDLAWTSRTLPPTACGVAVDNSISCPRKPPPTRRLFSLIQNTCETSRETLRESPVVVDSGCKGGRSSGHLATSHMTSDVSARSPQPRLAIVRSRVAQVSGPCRSEAFPRPIRSPCLVGSVREPPSPRVRAPCARPRLRW